MFIFKPVYFLFSKQGLQNVIQGRTNTLTRMEVSMCKPFFSECTVPSNELQGNSNMQIKMNNKTNFKMYS
jgi:hypothetical protein